MGSAAPQVWVLTKMPPEAAANVANEVDTSGDQTTALYQHTFISTTPRATAVDDLAQCPQAASRWLYVESPDPT